jgi:hypothetical protein
MIQCRFRRLLPLPVIFAAALAVPVFAHDANVSNASLIRNQVRQNWSIPVDLAGTDTVRVKIRVELDRSGQIIGAPDVMATGGPDETRKAIAKSAYRAVLRSAPFKNLPFDKYDAWREVTINFETSDLAH